MRIVFLGNNWVGWQILRWLKEQGENIVGLVVHPTHKQKYGKEIINSAALDSSYVFDGSRLREAEILDEIKALRPDLGISALFGYILRKEFLDFLPCGCVNIHPALLPYNRGAHPNVWSIIEGTPGGVSIHYIDQSVDTGDVIAQREVEVEPVDTGERLYRKLEKVAVELFAETWPLIRSGRAPRISQNNNQGTYHRVCDVEQIDEIDLNRTYAAKELIDVIRARTFPPYQGAYFRHHRRKVYLRLQLLYDEELGTGNDRSHD